MQFSTRDFFAEHDDPAVKGFAIIDTDDERGYRIAEKWHRPDSDDSWLTYWTYADTLEERVAAGHCEKTRTLSDKQYRGVLQCVGVSEQYEIPA